VVPVSALGWFGVLGEGDVPGVWARPGWGDGLWALLLGGVEARSVPLLGELAGVVVGVLVDGDDVLEGDDWAGFWFGGV
jgi:hypothetical protein